jgi:hypothetical protein
MSSEAAATSTTTVYEEPTQAPLLNFCGFRTRDASNMTFAIEEHASRRVFEVVAHAPGFAKPLRVVLLHSRLLAGMALDICSGLATNNVDASLAEENWTDLLKEDAKNLVSAGSDSVFKQARLREVVRNVYDSFRVEPLVRFGRVLCTRRSIECFVVSQEKASTFIHMIRTDGHPYLCWVGTKAQEGEAEKQLLTFEAIVNAQVVGTEVRLAQMGFPELAAKFKAEAAAKAAAEGPKTHEEGLRMAAQHVKNPTAHLDAKLKADAEVADEVEDVDEDEDVDDKPAKKSRAEPEETPATADPVMSAKPVKEAISLGFVKPLDPVVDDDEDEDKDDKMPPLQQLVISKPGDAKA